MSKVLSLGFQFKVLCFKFTFRVLGIGFKYSFKVLGLWLDLSLSLGI
jgi:hypothetical protein